MSMNIALYHTSTLLAKANGIKERLMMAHSHVKDPADRKRVLGHEMEDFLIQKYQDRPPGLSLCDEVSVFPPTNEDKLSGGKVPR